MKRDGEGGREGREGRETEEGRRQTIGSSVHVVCHVTGFDRVELSLTSTVDAPRRRKYRNLLIAWRVRFAGEETWFA